MQGFVRLLQQKKHTKGKETMALKTLVDGHFFSICGENDKVTMNIPEGARLVETLLKIRSIMKEHGWQTGDVDICVEKRLQAMQDFVDEKRYCC